MLIALVVACYLYFGAGHATALSPQFAQAEAGIKKNVHDEARRAQALKIVAEMKSAKTEFVKRRETSAKAVNEVLAKREVTGEELRAVASPLLTEDKQVRDRLLDLQFELRSVLTAAEWAQVYPP